MGQWAIRQHEKSQNISRTLDEIIECADKIINHPKTKQRYLHEFSNVEKYLNDKFPDVDVSGVKLYFAPKYVINSVGWSGIGGCYIDALKVIFVKTTLKNSVKKGKFNTLMAQYSPSSPEPEDILVHELLHAISYKMGRASRQFVHMEEEFVYTNCIDFYLSKGMSEDDIINSNFLPYFIQDVFESRADMEDVLSSINTPLSCFKSQKHWESTLDTFAEILVPLVIKKAQDRAKQMIYAYQKFGIHMNMNSGINYEANKVLRFSSLELD